MARITVELLRRRAEHNEGCLSNLKEIALHQQDIERIELIGDACRQLEIVYLCNNYISRIEGLRHLKWLTYLNLAVNNITVIEGLQGCEALERLDLTLNFISDVTSVQTLLANPFLASLHLTGNPCTKIAGYRAYVVHALPQLKELDGEEVIRAERIVARQDGEDVIEVAEEAAVRVRETERIKEEMIAKGIDPFPARFNEKGERVYGHTPEERLQMLREQQETEARQKAEKAVPQPGSIAALHQELQQQQRGGPRLTPAEEKVKYGRLLLRNEAKLPFHLNQDDAGAVVLTVEPGKFLSTTLISVVADVDVIRVTVKGKLLQVPVEGELAPDATQVQRSATTGQLHITVPYAPEVQTRRKAEHSKLQRLRGRLVTNEMTDTAIAAAASAGSAGEDLTRDTGTGKREEAAAAATTPARSKVLLEMEARLDDRKREEAPLPAASAPKEALTATKLVREVADCPAAATVVSDNGEECTWTEMD